MPKPSRIKSELPLKVREQLNKKLFENGFSDYQGLTDWLQELGYEISRSSVHRYGVKFKQEYDALKIATEQAKVIAETIPDDEGAMAEALTKIAQNKLMAALSGLNIEAYLEGDVVENLPKIVGAIAKLNQSSVNLKKYQREVKEKALAAAADFEAVAVKGGLSDTAVDEIKNKILGVGK